MLELNIASQAPIFINICISLTSGYCDVTIRERRFNISETYFMR